MSQPNALAAQRRKARHYGLQALYQWTLSGASATDIEAELRVDNDFQHTDGEYFSAVLKGVVKDCLLYTSPSPRDRTRSRMPSSA